MSYNPTSVITLDKSSGTPLVYAVAQGQYTRDWNKYYSFEPIAGGLTRLNFIDHGPGINQYTITLIVTTWSSDSLPYKLGATLSWQDQKTNLENSFKKIATPLYFLDAFGVSPLLNNKIGVFFIKFVETILPASTPSMMFIQYEIVLIQTPPGIGPL